MVYCPPVEAEVIAFLAANWRTMDDRQIAEKTGRTTNGIAKLRAYRGWKRPPCNRLEKPNLGSEASLARSGTYPPKPTGYRAAYLAAVGVMRDFPYDTSTAIRRGDELALIVAMHAEGPRMIERRR